VIESLQLQTPITIGPGLNVIAGQTYSFGIKYISNVDDAVQSAINITVGGVAWTSNMPRFDGQTAYHDFTVPASPGMYQASCAMDGQTGTLFDAVEMNVVAPSGPSPQPTVTLDITPNPMPYGGEYTATWTSSNVTELVVSWTGPDGGNTGLAMPSLNGSLTNPTGPVGTYIFTLTGTGSNGTAIDNVTFVVQPGSGPPSGFTESVYIYPPSTIGPLQAGQSYEFSFSYNSSAPDGASASFTFTVAGVAWSSNAPRNDGAIVSYTFTMPSTPGTYPVSLTFAGQQSTLTQNTSIQVG
jgi:hypothetical protein